MCESRKKDVSPVFSLHSTVHSAYKKVSNNFMHVRFRRLYRSVQSRILPISLTANSPMGMASLDPCIVHARSHTTHQTWPILRHARAVGGVAPMEYSYRRTRWCRLVRAHMVTEDLVP